MAQCTCSAGGFTNSGVPFCQSLQDVITKVIVVPLQDGSGNFNKIDTTVSPVLTQLQITALINQADDTQRFYPLPGPMENVTGERADPQTEEFPSGNSKKLRDGVRSFSGEMIDQGPIYTGVLNNYGCSQIGVYLVDQTGNLIGDISTPDELRPLKVYMPTWDARSIFTTDSVSNKVLLSFNFDRTLSDGDFGFVAASDFEDGVDWNDVNGLLDLKGTIAGSVTTTSASLKITNPYGSAASPQLQTGLKQADFSLNEVSPTPGPVTILTFSENPSGQYNFTFAAETSGDVLQLSVTANGFDDEGVESTAINIP